MTVHSDPHSHGASTEPTTYGLIAEFDDPHALFEAAKHVRAGGYSRTEAYTPIPIEGLAQALGKPLTRLPWLTFIGGVTGCLVAFGTQWVASTIHYPLNIGGRPLNSWPMFVPVTFEFTILLASFTTVLCMLALNGLPMPYHPVFNVSSFKLASRDRFFLCIEASDPKFDLVQTREFLESLHPLGVSEVTP